MSHELEVIYAQAHRARVVKSLSNGQIRIRFADTKLIPPEMDVPIEYLEYLWGGRYVNTSTHCPKCAVPWKETPGLRVSYFDCPQCGAKQEDHAAQGP